MFNNTRRILASLGAIGLYTAFNLAHEIASPLITGPQAAEQLTDSNVAYIGTQVDSRFFNGSGISIILLMIIFAFIWYSPIVSYFSNKETN